MKPDKTEQVASPAEFLEPLERGASVFGKGVRTFQEESLRFINRRLQDNANAVKDFAACKSIPDVLAAQQKWLTDMTRAYSEEWTRYGELMSGLLDEETHKRNSRTRSHH